MSGQPTGAKPKIVGGVTFRCYRVGINQYHWKSDDDRIVCGTSYSMATYWGTVDGQSLDKKFRRIDTAMKAAVVKAKATP